MSIGTITLSSGATLFVVKLASAFVRDMPAPPADSVLYAWLFDALMDAFDNPDRKGQRR